MIPEEYLERYGITYHKVPKVILRLDGTNIEQHVYESPRAKAIVSYTTKGKEKAPEVEVRILQWEKRLFREAKLKEAARPKRLNESEAQEYILEWLGTKKMGYPQVG